VSLNELGFVTLFYIGIGTISQESDSFIVIWFG